MQKKKLNPFATFFGAFALGLTFLTLSLGACSMISGRETPGQYVDDATITTRIKADLSGDRRIKPFQINVETFQGVVQLSGFVDSRQAADRAEQIARAVPSVKDVKNSLIVR